MAILIVPVPESISNHNYYQTWDPVAGGPGGDGEIEFTQDVIYQRSDTYIHCGQASPMYYMDQGTIPVLEDLPGHRVSSSGQYVALAANHPSTLAGSLVRHLLNGSDEHYNAPYVTALRGSPDLLDLVSGPLVILALVRVTASRHRRAGLGRHEYPALAAFLSPCVPALTSAMEPRFMPPLTVLCCLVVGLPGWRRDVTSLRASHGPATIGVAAVGAVLTLGAWLAITGSTFAALSVPGTSTSPRCARPAVSSALPSQP